MSQAERESSESEEIVVNRSCDLLALYDGIQKRMTMARGFLGIMATNNDGNDNVSNGAWGAAELLDQAGTLFEELQTRIDERERPRRGAAANRAARAHKLRAFTDFAIEMGKDKATARQIAKEVLAAAAKGPDVSASCVVSAPEANQ